MESIPSRHNKKSCTNPTLQICATPQLKGEKDATIPFWNQLYEKNEISCHLSRRVV
jgi:hypothetical protein